MDDPAHCVSPRTIKGCLLLNIVKNKGCLNGHLVCFFLRHVLLGRLTLPLMSDGGRSRAGESEKRADPGDGTSMGKKKPQQRGNR